MFWNWWNMRRCGSSSRCVRHLARYERVLGTFLELQVLARTAAAGQAAEAAVLQEIDRLENIFSTYRAGSELCQWQETRDTAEAVSLELATVLRDAEFWRTHTGGAFHPAVEALTRQWHAGAERGVQPEAETLARIVSELHAPLWDVDMEQGTARRRTRLPVTLNAIAKGFIIDQACELALRQPGVQAALVNIGGDIRHAGEKPVPAAIADPFAPQDNAAPLATVRIQNQGLATSGNYHRGFQVDNRRYSHVIDPRTGHPAEEVVSASVTAGGAQVADVLATAFSVMRPDESLRLADGLPNVAVLIVTQAGTAWSSRRWKEHTQ